MNKDLQQAFLGQLQKARGLNSKERNANIGKLILDRLNPHQRAMVQDPARQKAARCPRRSGKSFAALHYALHLVCTRPGSKILIVAKVRRQAKGVYWQKLKQICHELEIKAHYRNTELEVEFEETGSFINFTGADTIDEIEKFRGLDFDLVIIDEGKSYSAHLLKELIQDVIKPTLLDRRGTVLMIGTPGAVLAGPFYDITEGRTTKDFGVVRHYKDREEWGKKRFAWSLHQWSTADNVDCPWIWEGALEDKESNGWADDHPTWLREYKGLWVPDDEAMVYAYSKSNVEGKNNWFPLPADQTDNQWGLPPGHDWKYVLGVDLGYHDPTAFVVAAWAATNPKLYYVHAEKHSKMTAEGVADRTKELEAVFGEFMARICDTGGLGKMLVESMSISYGVHFEAAVKSEKHAHIKMVNSDYEAGRLLVSYNSPLHEELVTLQWAGHDRKIEDPGCANHCCDAALYIWRWCYHHLFQARKPMTDRGSEEWWRQQERDGEEKFRAQLLRDKNSEYWQKHAEKADKNPWEEKWNATALLRSLNL